MEFFQWKNNFNIGIAEIDRQHRSFLELLNEYYDSASGGTKDVIGDELIGRLKKYAAMHFRFEEDLMRSAGYQELERQLKQHQYFEALVSDLETAHAQKKAEMLKSALPLLRDWFLDHILEQDRNFVPYLKPPKQ